MESEIRNPKVEIRNKRENGKFEMLRESLSMYEAARRQEGHWLCRFGFRICFGFRFSHLVLESLVPSKLE